MRFGSIVLVLLSAACGDDSSSRPDAGGDPLACGPVRCSEGMMCCNTSCGICVPPGGGCSAEVCTDAGVDGGAFDAAGFDAAGLDAGGVTSDSGTGDAGTPMTCRSNTDCTAAAFCRLPAGMCAGTGTCEVRPRVCTEDCPGVCGCDGTTYCNECIAGSAGESIRSEEACEPTSCDAPEAEAEGASRTPLGWIWTGGGCVELTGLRCTGRGCTELYPNELLCTRAHATLCRSAARRCGLMMCAATEYCANGCSPGVIGSCRAGPRSCTTEYRPVTGCDDRQYRNECWAQLNGVDTTR
jgi:hypothetical protein